MWKIVIFTLRKIGLLTQRFSSNETEELNWLQRQRYERKMQCAVPKKKPQKHDRYFKLAKHAHAQTHAIKTETMALVQNHLI